MKILSVDDSEIIHNSLYNLLKEIEGLKWIKKAYSIEEAIETISSANPDIILIDIKIKDRTGFEVLEFIKQNFPQTTAIMISNFTTKPYQKKSFELGAKYFIDKSNEFEKLPSIISELVKSKK